MYPQDKFGDKQGETRVRPMEEELRDDIRANLSVFDKGIDSLLLRNLSLSKKLTESIASNQIASLVPLDDNSFLSQGNITGELYQMSSEILKPLKSINLGNGCSSVFANCTLPDGNIIFSDDKKGLFELDPKTFSYR